MDENKIRAALLQAVQEYGSFNNNLQTGNVLRKVAQRLGLEPYTAHNLPDQQLVLTLWYELFRTGQLAWGYGIGDPEPPNCHVTERGLATLKQLSRDPANSDGYLAYLQSQAPLNPIAESYLKEALQTYNNACFKATAVMIGAAAESISLELRDTLVARLAALGRPQQPQLSDWRIKTVLDAIERVLTAHKKSMPRPLEERFTMYWSAFTGQIRIARNDAGHPSSIDPVTPETVHAALLAFPDVAKIAIDITTWIKTHNF